MIETIPIDNDDAQAKRPFHVTVADLTAWPDQRLRVEFEYNPFMERYIFSVTHVGHGTIIPKSVATVDYQYSHWPYVLFSFITPAEDHGAVLPGNLGEGVQLGIFPGPDGGDFLPSADITEAERQELYGIQEVS